MENETPEPSQIIEALLFSTPEPLTLQQIKKITKFSNTKEISQIIKNLNQFYQDNSRTYEVAKIAGGFQLRTKKQYKVWINEVETLKPVRLSKSVLETLSIVAYKQPITRAEIDSMRGVDSSYGLKSLLEKGLIRIVGKKLEAGRPLIYGTSKKFLELFDFNSLGDLPKPEDLDLPE